MPTTVVKGRKTEDFKDFAKSGQRNQKLEQKIAVFLAELVNTKSRARVEALCSAQLAWLRSEDGGNYAPRSIPNRVTKYKKAIQACFSVHPIPDGLGVPVKTKAHGVIDVHIAQQLLQSSADETQISVDENKSKTDADQDNAQPFNLEDAIARTEEIVQNPDWRIAAAGLIFSCQCRPVDLTLLGEVKAVSRYTIDFTTRAKQRGKTKTQTIFTIVRADMFVDAFNRIRRDSALMGLKGLSPSEADSRTNKTINREVRNAYADIIPAPFTEDVLSAHNLRAAGARVAYHLYAEKGVDAQRFVELQLIHDSKAASANYNDYYCVDAKNEEITRKGIRQDATEPLASSPKSEKRSSVSVDAQLRDMIGDAERWGEGSHADRLERIIARAGLADRLERQLARECEKRQALELKLKRLESSQNASQPSTPEEKLAAIENEPSGFDWRSVPNSELNGDNRHDAYAEKLRRSVEAIQDYNAGREFDEQFSITGSILRQLSKVSPTKVSGWMKDHKAELDSYNSAANYGVRHNTGKPDPRSVIKWSEQAYGEYKW